MAHVDLEATGTLGVRWGTPGRKNSSLVALLANDALALDQNLQITNARALAEIRDGLSLEFCPFGLAALVVRGACLKMPFLRAPGSPREGSHGLRIGKKSSHKVDIHVREHVGCGRCVFIWLALGCSLRLRMSSHHIRAAIQQQMAREVFGDDKLCAGATEMAQAEEHLCKTLAVHARFKRLVQLQAKVNTEAERARKRETHHQRRI